MFIIWGKKRVARKVGYVADFCQVCREPQSFSLNRIGSAGHIYYITFSSGKLVGFERACQKCQTQFPANPDHYVSISKRKIELEALTALTYPNLGEVMIAQIELEDRVRLDITSFSPDARLALIIDRMMSFASKVESRFAAFHVDKEIGIAIIVAALLMAFGPEVVGHFLPEGAPSALPFFVWAGIILVLWQFIVSGRRFMNRQILPLLARSLHPINPLENELHQVVAELTRRGLKIGIKLNLKNLKARLQSSTFLR